MDRAKALLAGIFAGLAAPSTIAQHHRYSHLQGTDLQRIRGDVEKVGRTFNKVISRERIQKASRVTEV